MNHGQAPVSQGFGGECRRRPKRKLEDNIKTDLEKYNRMVRTGFIRQLSSGFHKMLRNSLVGELLAVSQGGFSSME
jgi:hypothetical protein